MSRKSLYVRRVCVNVCMYVCCVCSVGIQEAKVSAARTWVTVGVRAYVRVCVCVCVCVCRVCVCIHARSHFGLALYTIRYRFPRLPMASRFVPEMLPDGGSAPRPAVPRRTLDGDDQDQDEQSRKRVRQEIWKFHAPNRMPEKDFGVIREYARIEAMFEIAARLRREAREKLAEIEVFPLRERAWLG